MRISTVCCIISAATSISARSAFSFFGNEQVTISDELQVPGNNPLTYCEETSNNILQIDHVDLSPNPPEAGKTLSIQAKGTLSKDIEEGARVHLTVKYGLITLINQDADLCEQLKNVDLECPVKKGEMELTKEVNLPREIPPGRYQVFADVYTKDDEKLTCITARVMFGRR